VETERQGNDLLDENVIDQGLLLLEMEMEVMIDEALGMIVDHHLPRLTRVTTFTLVDSPSLLMSLRSRRSLERLERSTRLKSCKTPTPRRAEVSDS